MLSRSDSTNANNSVSFATMNRRSSGEDNHSHDPHDHNPSESNYGLFSLSGSRQSSSRPIMDSRASFDGPRPFGGRTSSFRTGASFPSHQIVIFDPQTPRQSNPHWHTRPTVEERHYYSPTPRTEHLQARPLPEQQNNKALESLRKELYNPSSKRITNTINLYYRDTPVNPRDIANQEDGKRCAVCLEDFERGHEVMLTPCNHMFHEDCIVPWARSNAQCPVCRFVFGPKAEESSSSSYAAFPFNSSYGNRIANTVGRGLTTHELVSIIRALGDDYQLSF